MGSSQDPNPFVEGGNVNPHVNPNANSKPSTIPQESGTTVEITIDNIEDLKARQKKLEAREAELKKREEELKKREEEVAKFIEEKNWPPFYPLIHHDIAKEIPIHLQKIQYVAFGSWLGLMVCLAWNFIAITAAWFQGQDAEIWLLAVIFIITGVPGSYFLWYRPLYRAMRTDSALKFSLFFLTYIGHITFCVFATIAPPMFIEGKSLAGIMPAIDYLTWNATLGGLYFIGFGLFALETSISIWVIQEVYWYFRGSGKAAQIKRQAITTTMMQSL